MVVTEPGIVTVAIKLQPLKALYPIAFTDEGVEKLTDVKPIQLRKASSPTEVTDVGMSIETNFEQDLKVPSPIAVTDEGVEKITVVKPLQLRKAEPPIEVTDTGIVTELKPLQL